MSTTHRPAAPDASTSAVLRLAWPLFFANLAVVGNGTIDAVMAGRLSAEDMAGVAVASSIYVTVYIGFMAVLQALSPIAGHHYGAQRWRAIGDDLQQALWLSALLLIVALPCVLATGFWNGIASVDARVAEITTSYLHAVAFGLPAGLATRVFVALNAAVSRPMVTMVINLTVLGLKAPLNAVFMYGWGPFDAMGGAGAGVATALLAWLALGMSVAIWRTGPLLRPVSQRIGARTALVPPARTAAARTADRNVDAVRGDQLHVHGRAHRAPRCHVGRRPPDRRQPRRDSFHGPAVAGHRHQCPGGPVVG